MRIVGPIQFLRSWLIIIIFLGGRLRDLSNFYFFYFFLINHATSSNLYRSYYPHQSRELVSPVCGIFCCHLYQYVYQVYLVFNNEAHRLFCLLGCSYRKLVSVATLKIKMYTSQHHCYYCLFTRALTLVGPWSWHHPERRSSTSK